MKDDNKRTEIFNRVLLISVIVLIVGIIIAVVIIKAIKKEASYHHSRAAQDAADYFDFEDRDEYHAFCLGYDAAIEAIADEVRFGDAAKEYGFIDEFEVEVSVEAYRDGYEDALQELRENSQTYEDGYEDGYSDGLYDGYGSCMVDYGLE